MRYFLFITILFSFLAQAQTPTAANFSGKWVGQAILTNKQGQKTTCEQVVINVQQAKDHASFGEFSYLCGGLEITFVPPTLQIQDGEVYFKNQFNNLVGTIDNQTVDLQFIINAQNGRDHYVVKKISDSTIGYLYEAIDVDPTTGAELMRSLQGQLKKVN